MINLDREPTVEHLYALIEEATQPCRCGPVMREGQMCRPCGARKLCNEVIVLAEIVRK